MASKLERTISDLNTKKIELESIVESITTELLQWTAITRLY